MISFIKGKNIEISPTKLIVDVNGVGYEILISLRTYSKIKNIDKVNIYTFKCQRGFPYFIWFLQ